ncbi:ArsR/SmtB family transcription factor [Geomobilimonas luticola]|jgi:DNA-binding transcriptional ArsR family regulator|uniref:Winged helix-turn-helix domain-containing protein n=1 Tax=Geomobilimonas luticola TaxID=1114878 RepID=A0ABS5SGQ7_9BACT|nr:metalloregulator ArsR/SmtB family transcription factor [Geomobilimonas luticola]MBT0653217.1 winged helix-turn-helix domain-containing protein [Geomobilimonas luticola]
MSNISNFRADILKALAQPTRLKIIDFLRDGERCVCEIFPAIGEEQSNTSRHLNMMLTAGVLTRRKEGLKIFYAIKHLEILEVVDTVTLIVKLEAAGRHELLKAV